MSDGDSMAQLAAVILLLALAVPALATAHEFAGTPMSYSESATVDYGNQTVVSEAATVEGYGGDPVVVVDGDELVAGVDYRWNDSAGSVEWLNSTNTSAGDTARVEYLAHQRTEETALAWDILAPFMGLFGLFGLIASVRTLWSYSAEVWDLR